MCKPGRSAGTPRGTCPPSCPNIRPDGRAGRKSQRRGATDRQPRAHAARTCTPLPCCCAGRAGSSATNAATPPRLQLLRYSNHPQRPARAPPATAERFPAPTSPTRTTGSALAFFFTSRTTVAVHHESSNPPMSSTPSPATCSHGSGRSGQQSAPRHKAARLLLTTLADPQPAGCRSLGRAPLQAKQRRRRRRQQGAFRIDSVATP